jgi:hypothetical protein
MLSSRQLRHVVCYFVSIRRRDRQVGSAAFESATKLSRSTETKLSTSLLSSRNDVNPIMFHRQPLSVTKFPLLWVIRNAHYHERLSRPPPQLRFYSSSEPPREFPPPTPSEESSSQSFQSPSESSPTLPRKPKSTTERDSEHLEKMREAMGGSDLANVEMEDGLPDRGMKRRVRENMFRLI